MPSILNRHFQLGDLVLLSDNRLLRILNPNLHGDSFSEEMVLLVQDTQTMERVCYSLWWLVVNEYQIPEDPDEITEDDCRF